MKALIGIFLGNCRDPRVGKERRTLIDKLLRFRALLLRRQRSYRSWRIQGGKLHMQSYSESVLIRGKRREEGEGRGGRKERNWESLRTTVKPSSANSRASLTVYILTAAFEIESTRLIECESVSVSFRDSLYSFLSKDEEIRKNVQAEATGILP